MERAGVIQDSPAQTRSEMRMDHASPGHQMNGPLDGAFHHRFEDAKKWAEEFDNPERDAWQKPEEILDALHLQRTSQKVCHIDGLVTLEIADLS
jgi:hypothetical protein